VALLSIGTVFILLMHLRADYEQQRLHLMRKHGIDLEDNPQDGSRTKRLDRKDFEALMGGDGRSGIFTWREKNRRKVRTIFVLVLAKSSHRRSMHLSVGVLSVCTISDSACLLLTKHWQLWHKFLQWALSFGVKSCGMLTQLLSGSGGYSRPRLFVLLRLVELRRYYV
jgi:hypothetical protein